MVGLSDPRSVRRRRGVRFALLALAGLLFGHTVVYAGAYGDGAGFARAMSLGGHDAYWPIFAGAALAGLVVLGADGLLGLLRAARARRPEPRSRSEARPNQQLRPRPEPRPRPEVAAADRDRPDRLAAADEAPDYLTELLDLWGPLFVVVSLAFLVQENLEASIVLGHAPLLGVFTAHLLAAPLLAIVTGILAALGALVRWRISVLSRGIRRTPASWARIVGRRPDRRWGRDGLARPARWALLSQDIGRAPPAPSSAPA